MFNLQYSQKIQSKTDQGIHGHLVTIGRQQSMDIK